MVHGQNRIPVVGSGRMVIKKKTGKANYKILVLFYVLSKVSVMISR